MKNPILSILYFLAVLFISACSFGGQGNDSERVNLNAGEAKVMIDENIENEMFVILDTRTSTEYHNGHLKNAEFYNYSASNFWDQIKSLDPTKTYLVYCHSGGRSGKTVKFMKKNGIEKAYNLDGGIVSWKRAGYKVLTGN